MSKGLRISRPTKPKRKKTQKPKRGELIAIENRFQEYQAQAAKHGLQLKVSRVNGLRFDHCHVMLNQGKFRIANWWPSNGTLTIGAVKTKAKDFQAVLRMIELSGIERIDGENKTGLGKIDQQQSQSNEIVEVSA